MLAKKITYTNFNGEEVTETFYFNISRAELMEMEIMHPGGYADYLQKIVDAKDQVSVFTAFKELVKSAYGEKTDDGKRFRKSEELSEAFLQSEAYSELLTELVTSADMAAKFVNGIMPTMNLDENQKAQLAAKTKEKIAELEGAVSSN